MYDESDENYRKLGDYILRRTDPYGLWIVLNDKGKLAKGFENETFSSAKLAAIEVKVREEKKKKTTKTQDS